MIIIKKGFSLNLTSGCGFVIRKADFQPASRVTKYLTRLSVNSIMETASYKQARHDLHVLSNV